MYICKRQNGKDSFLCIWIHLLSHLNDKIPFVVEKFMQNDYSLHIVDVCFWRNYNIKEIAAEDIFRLFRESRNCGNVVTIKKENAHDYRS